MGGGVGIAVIADIARHLTPESQKRAFPDPGHRRDRKGRTLPLIHTDDTGRNRVRIAKPTPIWDVVGWSGRGRAGGLRTAIQPASQPARLFYYGCL